LKTPSTLVEESTVNTGHRGGGGGGIYHK
jgi:hypothetical protein